MRGLLIFAAMAVAFGQSPTFEVISIKASPPPEGNTSFTGSRGGPGSRDPGLWTCQNMSIWNLMMVAFDLRSNELSGPEWLHEPRFDINAKVPRGATKEQFQDMMQNMLKDRFGLRSHKETKEVQGFELLVGKGGPKFKESGPEPPDGVPGGEGRAVGAGGAKLGPDGFPILPPGRPGVIMMPDRVSSQWVRATLDTVARSLTYHAGKPVVNATGLAGRYDLALHFLTRSATAAPPAGGSDIVPASSEPAGPSLFTALQEQLGLKLEPKKVKVEFLVVDHVERVPTEN